MAKQTPRRAARHKKMPIGPNPAAARGLCVRPFGSIYALVEGLGVISAHKLEAEAQTALEHELERREALRVVKDENAVQAPKDEPGGGDG